MGPIVIVRKRATGAAPPAPVAPTNTVAPAVTGTATVGQLLSTTDGTWTGDPVISFTYQWQRDGADIGGATANTYTLVIADYGKAIRCVVTGTNGVGSSSANSNATAAVTFDPATITGLAAWYDASDAASFTFSSGTVVSQWNDLSGNALNISQGTVASQPSRSGTQNGRSTVVFDGINDMLSRNPGGPAQPMTFLAAAKFSNLDTSDHVLWNQGPGGPQFQTNGGTWQVYAGAALNSGVTDDALWNVHVVVCNGASSFIYKNGSQIATGNIGATSGGDIRIGAYQSAVSFWAGEVAEVLLYTGALSGPNRNTLEAYLKAKWATT